ncbi:MAG TPA: ABC transporter substrate-binding protein [Solirubrobacterales bacterium]|nr:ABC transporter substrate-binding protein [Solirubrobacterales bacterium]
MKKLGVVLAAIVLTTGAALGLTACGSSSGGKEGGTLEATYVSFPDSLDPAISYTAEGWTAMYNTYLPLLTYKHASGTEGSEVVPALAKDLPKISNGGKTYTLFLRPGLKYSDGQPVKASDFAASVERLFEVNSGGSPLYTGIVGAEKFAETRKGGISGIETDDETGEIRIDLVQPRATFSNELGMLFVAVLPADTPSKDQTASPPPATGPYVITKSQPGRGWSYDRNPFWEKANAKAMPDLPGGSMDKIEITVVGNDTTQVSDVERGKYDWMQNPPGPDEYTRVKEEFEGTQFRVEETISTYFFWMNTERPPFDDVKVRQAVNYAVDGEAMERIYAGQLAASQQIIPPGVPGYEKFELYPHNLEKAKQLLVEADPADREITVWTLDEPENREAAEYYDDVLRQIGFETTLKVINAETYFTLIGNERTPDLDTGWANWFLDYPNPNALFQPLLSGESIQATGNTNLARMADPALDAKIDELSQQDLSPEVEAEYADLDREYMELAPLAPYGNRATSTFVSSEIDLDEVVFNPTFGQDLTSFQFK